MSFPDDRFGSFSPGTVRVSGPADAFPIVFVHGAGISHHMWRPQLESLSEEFRVVAFDLPGHGTLSEMEFDFDVAVGRLSDVVDECGGSTVGLVGHSLGGYVALDYAARTPDRVAGLVLSGSSADYRGQLGIRTRVTAALYKLGGRIPFIDQWFHERTAGQIRALPISEATAQSIIDGGFYLRSWGQAGSALVGRDFQKRLRGYRGPTLLLNGEDDHLNVPNADALAATHENVEADVVADAGHLCNLQAPSAYTDRVRKFVHEHGLHETTDSHGKV